MSTTAQPRLTDIGPPSYQKFLHPLVKKNYGQWKYHENLAPGVLCHVAESGDRIYIGPRRHAAPDQYPDLAPICGSGGQVLWRLPPLHQPQQHRVPARRQGQDRTPEEGIVPGRVSHWWHQQRHQQYGAHSGLGALPLRRDGCLGHREVRHGRALRPLYARGPAREVAHRPGLLPQHVRRSALLRHRHPGGPSPAAEDSARCSSAGVRDPDPDLLLPDGRDPSEDGRRQELGRGDRGAVHVSAATATPCARPCP